MFSWMHAPEPEQQKHLDGEGAETWEVHQEYAAEAVLAVARGPWGAAAVTMRAHTAAVANRSKIQRAQTQNPYQKTARNPRPS